MVNTRRSGDSHGNTSTEMPVRENSADNISIEVKSEPGMSRKYSDAMDETRNVRRRSTSDRGRERELRSRGVSMSNGNRVSTRIRDRPDRFGFRPAQSNIGRRKLLRPRNASHLAFLRQLGRNDEVDTGTEEDAGSEDDDIFTPAVKRRPRRAVRRSESPGKSDYESQRMTNGHSSKILDDSNEGIRRSTRKRKLVYDNFNTSWILGTQNVRGYRTNENHTEEEEEEEEEEEGEESVDEEGEESVDEEGGEENESEGNDNKTGEPAEEKAKEEKSQESGEESPDKDAAQDKDENFEDMYSRVKRPRRKRILFAEQRNTRSRTRSRKESESSDNEGHSSEDERPQSPRRHSKYHLRQRKPKVQHFQIGEFRAEPLRRAAMSLLRSPMRRKRSRRSRYKRSDSSSSTSDSEYERKKARNRNMCLPVNFASTDKKSGMSQTSKVGGKSGVGVNLADTDPMELDPNIRFTDVGGLDEHIRCLKEVVVFPMLYPEIFDKFKVQPPKGVLFHGPPGTGKTLLARALANECSLGERRVAFFMRKGADCLSKWVGESERQLRLLFEQAYQMRPSIIFFDELDGLAPVRSYKQDQIHASIVSTLLALMDGLKNRGEVLLIGATNRIDAIDPALRRPGRFDRELFFPLPAAKERLEILNIHMSAWKQVPPPELVAHLAETSSGYCGSDLRALCTEAVIQGLRRRYPQIYNSSQKLLLDPSQVEVERCDFARAQLGIVPASHRVAHSPSHRLAAHVTPLLGNALSKAVEQLAQTFPQCNMKSAIECKLLAARVPHPRLLITGNDDQGQVIHMGPALLHHMEHVSVHSLELGVLFGTPSTSPEEVCVQLFREANRQLPAVLYIPEVDRWWQLVPRTVQALLLSRLAGLQPFSSLLLLSTSNCPFDSLPDEVKELFSVYRGEVLNMENPTRTERDKFLRPLFLTLPLQPPVQPVEQKLDVLEVLPVAPPPEPPKLTEEQTADLYKKEEMTLRELRIFLREICGKLARNKQFFMFVQPVDLEEAPDYLEIIKDPMDLETIMSKIDRHEYACAAEFLADVDLICRNALEYNPDRSNQGKMIRHRACYLHDTAHALIKAEMDSDFEDQCKEISTNRKKRAFEANKLAPDFVYTASVETKPLDTSKDKNVSSKSAANDGDFIDEEGSSQNKYLATPSTSTAEPRHKKRKSPWARGLIPSVKKKKRAASETEKDPDTDTGGRNSPVEDDTSLSSAEKDVKLASPAVEDESIEAEVIKRLEVDQQQLEKLLHNALDITVDLPLTPLLDLHAQLSIIINKFSSLYDRSNLPYEMELELNRFEKLVSSEYK